MTSLQPFGLLLEGVAELSDLPADQLKALVASHRVVVIRGARPPEQEEMLDYCRQLGQILEWQFGAVNELKASSEAKNYLYTPAPVPYHWDGAFVGKIPHYIFFHCQQAPDPEAGGETTFCDTCQIWKEASPEQQALWSATSVTYSTEKVVHYGGSFSSPLVARHPVSGETVLRYAEPVRDLNPVRLEFQPPESARVEAEMADLLYRPRYQYAHSWRTGDIVIADNHALLHGRNGYRRESPRHLRRVNIL